MPSLFTNLQLCPQFSINQHTTSTRHTATRTSISASQGSATHWMWYVFATLKGTCRTAMEKEAYKTALQCNMVLGNYNAAFGLKLLSQHNNKQKADYTRFTTVQEQQHQLISLVRTIHKWANKPQQSQLVRAISMQTHRRWLLNISSTKNERKIKRKNCKCYTYNTLEKYSSQKYNQNTRSGWHAVSQH